MIITIGAGETTKSFADFKQNTYASSISNPSACGTSYQFTFSPMMFLTFANDALNGQTMDVALIGVYTILMTVQLVGQPAAIRTQTFSLEVTCILQSPTFAGSALTLEIGIAFDPYEITFSQTQSCGVSATLVASPTSLSSWLSLSSSTSSGGSIRITGVTLAQVGEYTLTLTNALTSQTQSASFTLIMKDPCSRAVFKTSPSPFSTISVTMPSITHFDTPFKVYTDVELENSGIICPINVMITAGYAPVSIVDLNSKVRVDPNLVSVPGDYGSHLITVQISSSNNASSVMPVTFTFNVQIVNNIDCTTTTITFRILEDLQTTVGESNSLDISFNDAVGTAQNNQALCGPRSFSFTPSPNFASISGNTFTINPTLVEDACTLNVTLTIGLTDFLTVSTIQVPFKIIVTCQVMTLTFITPPLSLITIKIGIDTQPSFSAFSVAKTPNCPQTVMFELSGTIENFVSIQNQLNASADIQITGATISNHGSYLLTLSASVDSKIANESFTVQIQDPCSYAIFETEQAPFSEMSLTLYPSRSVSVLQNFRIYTDIEKSYSSIICPITAQVLPSKPFVLMASDYKSITIDGQYATLQDAGQYSLTVQVNSSVFTSVRADYSLKVVLNACYSTQFQMTNTITDLSYDTTLGTLTTTPFQIQQTNEDCGYPVTYQLAIAQNLVTIPKPNWLTTNFVQRTLSISQTQKTDVGAYDVSITASIPQIDPATNNFSAVSFNFKITIIDECLQTAFIDRQFSLVQAKVSQGPVTADLTVNDQVSLRHVDASYCGTKTYTISPTLPFINLIGATLHVESQSVVEAGDYSVTLLASLLSYSGVGKFTKTFIVQIQCEVISISAILAPQDVTFKLHTDTVINSPFSFQEFPSCGLTYLLTPSHKNFIMLDASTRQISVYTEKDEDEGLYNLSLQVTPQTVGAQKEFPFKINVTNPCLKTVIRSSTVIPNVLALIPAKPFYDIPVSFYHTVQNTTNCGVIEAYVRDFQTKKTPDWSNFQGQRLQIDLQTQTKEIQSQMELIATLSRYPDIKYVQQFNVTLSTLNVQCSPQTTNYEVGAELSIKVSYSIQTQHKMKLTPIFSFVSIDDKGNETEGLPPFVKFIEDSKTFVVYTNNPFDEGEYTFGLKIGFEDIKHFQTTCATRIKIKYTPIKDQTTECNQRWVFKIPEYSDSTGGKLGMEIDLQDAASFLKVQDGFIIYEPVLVVPADYPMKYTVVSNEDSREFRFTLGMSCQDQIIPVPVEPVEKKDDQVPAFRPNFFVKNTPEPNIGPNVVVKNPPRPYIASIDNVGLIKIQFTQKLLIPSYDLYPEFLRQEYMREVNFTGLRNETQPQAPRHLAQVQQKKTEVEAIEIINRGNVFVNNTQLPLVQLSLISTEGNSFQSEKSFTYKCVSFKESYMEFQANFTNIDYISIAEKDVMSAKFNGAQYFRTPDNVSIAESEILEVKKFVPQQIELILADQLKKAAGVMKNSSKAAVIFNFVMNMVFSGALQEMLSAMKKMQIMIHMLLINVQIPPSAQIFFSSLLKLVTFEIIDISSYIRKVLNLEEDAGLSSNFEELGYQSQFSIILLGNLYIALILMLLGLIFIFSTRRFKSKQWFNKLRNNLKTKLIWHGALGLINESYLIICISCFVNLISTKKASKFGEYFSITNAFLFLVVVLGYPILILIILVKNQPKLHLKQFKTRFGDFYLHFRYKEGRHTVLEPFYAALRRLIHAVTVVFFVSQPFMQIMVIFYSWNITNMLNSQFLLYKLKSDLYTDLVNEFFLVLVMYNLLVFSDIISDQRAKNYLGYAIIAVILLNIVFNFTLIISSQIGQLIRAIKTKYLIWKRNRLLKRLAYLLDSDSSIDDLPQQKEKISNQQLKKRDLNWYQTVTSTQHQDQKIEGNLQIQVNDELIEYNRSSEGLISIKRRNPITYDRNQISWPEKTHSQLQIIQEDASNETSPKYIDSYYQDFSRQGSTLTHLQNAVMIQHSSSQPMPEIPQIEEENLLQDAHYWALMRDNFNENPTFNVFELQKAQERKSYLQNVQQSSYFDKHFKKKNVQMNTRKQKSEFFSELAIEDFKQEEQNQIGDLDDQFALGEREKKRQLSHRKLFANPEQSHQMFEELWNLDLISQDKTRNFQNDQSKTK